jgi:3-oxoacyl-[acyl-carrier-protein] synthase III
MTLNPAVPAKHHSFIASSGILFCMQILQLSTALPDNEYSTEQLIEKFPCRLPEGVVKNVLNLGVSKRRLISREASEKETLMDGKSLIDLCSEACHKVMEKLELTAKKVGCLITAYEANPFLSPGLSQILVPKLGLDPFVKHFNAQGVASTAFVQTLELANNHLTVHPKDKVLICVSGANSYWFQNQVRGLKGVMETAQIGLINNNIRKQMELRKWVATMQFFLFGDGIAAAVVADEGEGLKVDRTVEVTNIGEKDYLAGYARLSSLNEPFKFGFYSHLDREIPSLGVKYTDVALEKLFGRKAYRATKTVRKWAVHTGSAKILDALAEHHGIERDKLRESHEVLRDHGNLACASLPFILERILSTTKFAKGDNILMLGYGWGFSSAACLLKHG